MATHSSILAWRIVWTEEPGGLLSIGSHRVGHDWSDLAAAAAAYSILGKKLVHSRYRENQQTEMESASRGPQSFWHQGPISWKIIFPSTRVWEGGFGMIQASYIYCVLYFYYYYIHSTLDHQALDTRYWGSLQDMMSCVWKTSSGLQASTLYISEMDLRKYFAVRHKIYPK